MQTLGDRQSALPVHDVRQAPVPHAYGLQLLFETVWHVPVPLQVRAGVKVDAEQAGATHCVPVTYNRHAPAPLHVPSLPQLMEPASVHWLSGSAPAGTLAHVPSEP